MYFGLRGLSDMTAKDRWLLNRGDHVSLTVFPELVFLQNFVQAARLGI